LKVLFHFHCVTRSQWLELRIEYLSLQKSNIAQLKQSLKALNQQNTNETTGCIKVNCLVWICH